MKAGECVVITGVTGGLGSELAQLCFAAGLHVFGVDIDKAGLEALQDRFRKDGYKFSFAVTDICDKNSIQNACDNAVSQFGKVDYWVNAAGIAHNERFSETSDDVFERVVDTNLIGLINATRIALKQMKHQAKGQIVNVGSVAGHVPAPFMSSYCTAKFGVVGFTRSLQIELELCDSPVLVQLISPGFVNTKMIALGEKMGFPEWLKFLLADPKDVARDIYDAMCQKKREITPTVNGKIMKGLHHLFPKTTVRSSKILLTRGFKDYLLNRYHVD